MSTTACHIVVHREKPSLPWAGSSRVMVCLIREVTLEALNKGSMVSSR